MVTSISKKNTENEKEEVAPFAVISLPATCTFTYGKKQNKTIHYIYNSSCCFMIRGHGQLCYIRLIAHSYEVDINILKNNKD